MYILHWISKLDSEEKVESISDEWVAHYELDLFLAHDFKAWLTICKEILI